MLRALSLALLILTPSWFSHAASDKLCRLYLELEGRLASVPSPENPARIRMEWEIVQDPFTGYEWTIRQLESQIIRLTGEISQSPRLPVYYPDSTPGLGDVTALGVSFGEEDDEHDTDTEWNGSNEDGTFSFEGAPSERSYRRDDRLAGDLVLHFNFERNTLAWTFQSYSDPTHRDVGVTQGLRQGNLQAIEFQLSDGPGPLLSRSIAGVSRALRETYGEDYRVVPKVREMMVQAENQREYLLRSSPLWIGHFNPSQYKVAGPSELPWAPVNAKIQELVRELLLVGPLHRSGTPPSSHGSGRIWKASDGQDEEIVVEVFNASTEYSTAIGFSIEKI